MGRFLRWVDSWMPKDPVQVMAERAVKTRKAAELTLANYLAERDKDERRLRHTTPEFWSGGRREPRPWCIVHPWELPE